MRFTNESYCLAKASELLEEAMNLYKQMVFEADKSNQVMAAGYIVDYLSDAVALMNGRYFILASIDKIKVMKTFKKLPRQYVEMVKRLYESKSIGDYKLVSEQLIQSVRLFLGTFIEDAVAEKGDFKDLADWYQELIYTFRRIRYYCDEGNIEAAFNWGIMMQQELNYVSKSFGLKQMPLMASFDADHLNLLKTMSDRHEKYIIKSIQTMGIKLNSYESIESFLNSLRYKNASDILPDSLLKEIQKYTDGQAIYIPKKQTHKKWGEGSGARRYYSERNDLIRKRYAEGVDLESLSKNFGLAFETVKKIVYSK